MRAGMALPRISDPGTPISAAPFPETEADRDRVRAQLERVLAHPLFTNSRRYPRLLRYVVETTLDNPSECLKERTLGIQVFGREPQYDTNVDHVVRTTAGEVRKRLQQYYLDDGALAEIIIELPSGSYVPLFRIAQPRTVTEVIVPPEPPRKQRSLLPLAATLAVGILLGVAAVRLWPAPRPSPTDRFWAPVVNAPNRAALCIGSTEKVPSPGVDPPTSAQEQRTLIDLHRSEQQKVAFSDALTLARLTGLLRAKGKHLQILQEASATLADLTEGPTILIGAFDNDWTLRLTGPLRFRFELEMPRGVSYIRDSRNPSRSDWTVNWYTPYLQLGRDYAIVSRVLDRTTKQPVIVAAGITRYGTLAAGEFLTSDSYMAELDRVAPRGWEHRNIQIVLSAQVIRGSSGAPEIVATHVW